MEADVTGLVRAIDKLEHNGVRFIDEGLREMANDIARHTRHEIPRRTGASADRVKVWGEDGVYLIGVEKGGHEAEGLSQEDDRVGNWQRYGTGGRRGSGRRRSSATRGIKGTRFLIKPPARVRQAMLLAAILRAATRAGFEIGGPA
jgi:hypothetical protein